MILHKKTSSESKESQASLIDQDNTLKKKDVMEVISGHRMNDSDTVSQVSGAITEESALDQHQISILLNSRKKKPFLRRLKRALCEEWETLMTKNIKEDDFDYENQEVIVFTRETRTYFNTTFRLLIFKHTLILFLSRITAMHLEPISSTLPLLLALFCLNIVSKVLSFDISTAVIVILYFAEIGLSSLILSRYDKFGWYYQMGNILICIFFTILIKNSPIRQKSMSILTSFWSCYWFCMIVFFITMPPFWILMTVPFIVALSLSIKIRCINQKLQKFVIVQIRDCLCESVGVEFNSILEVSKFIRRCGKRALEIWLS